MTFQNCRIVKSSVTPEEYLAQNANRGTPAFAMSSSELRTFGRCPRRWLRGYQPPVTEAKEHGSHLDCLVLTPEQFDKRYAVCPTTYTDWVMECPGCGSRTDSKVCRKCSRDRVAVGVKKPWNKNAGACQDWDMQVAKGRETVSAEDMAELLSAAGRIEEDETIKAFFDASDRQVWVAGEYVDEETGLTIPVKCLIDLVPRLDTEFAACLGDLKTTRSAALMPWQRHCYEMGYYIQAAFNLDLYMAATEGKEDRNTFCFLLQENYAPWEPARRMLAADFLTLGRADYAQLLANYCRCLKSNEWPSYDDTDEAVQGWSLVSPEPWMSSREQFAPKMQFHDESESDSQPAESECGVTP